MNAPPFSYFGGKTNLASKIVEHLPAHEHYVEPFAGSLAVLLAKPRADHETVNDLDGDLMTFWRVLRDHPDDLANVMRLTPHSRAEYANASDALAECPSDLERARLVWVKLSQGRGGTMRPTGWRFYRDPVGTSVGMPGYLAGYAKRVPACARRLMGVSLESRPALDVIRDYGSEPDVLLYCDPPYLGATRSLNYRHEMPGRAEHEELASALHDCRATVVLSGYNSDLYADLFADWSRVDLKGWTGNGIRRGATKANGDRVEVLWSNRQIIKQSALLDMDGEVPR